MAMNWNTGLAMAEMISAAFLFFTVLAVKFVVFNKYQKYQLTIAGISLGIGCFIAASLGWMVGMAINGSYGLSFMTPISVIVQSIKHNSYNAIWFLCLAQIIGTVIGYLMFYGYRQFLNKDWKFAPKKTTTITYTSLKSVIFQFLLISGIILIPTLTIITNENNFIITRLILICYFMIIFWLSNKYGSIVFSPWISFGSIWIFWRQKKLTKAIINNVSCEILIQLVLTIGLILLLINF